VTMTPPGAHCTLQKRVPSCTLLQWKAEVKAGVWRYISEQKGRMVVIKGSRALA
jgi:hypothetical protein